MDKTVEEGEDEDQDDIDSVSKWTLVGECFVDPSTESSIVNAIDEADDRCWNRQNGYREDNGDNSCRVDFQWNVRIAFSLEPRTCGTVGILDRHFPETTLHNRNKDDNSKVNQHDKQED